MKTPSESNKVPKNARAKGPRVIGAKFMIEPGKRYYYNDRLMAETKKYWKHKILPGVRR